MDKRLSNLINDYLKAVQSAIFLLSEKGIPLPESNIDWVFISIPHTGNLVDNVTYFKHGYGCAVNFEEYIVDFDFGENGETTGFDLSRLALFAKNKLEKYGFHNIEDLESSFKSAKEAGEIVHSGYILYYLR